MNIQLSFDNWSQVEEFCEQIAKRKTALTAVPSAPVATTKSAENQAVKQTATVATPSIEEVEEDLGGEPTVTKESLLAKTGTLAKSGHHATIKKWLTEHKATNVSTLAEDQYVDYDKFLNELK